MSELKEVKLRMRQPKILPISGLLTLNESYLPSRRNEL